MMQRNGRPSHNNGFATAGLNLVEQQRLIIDMLLCNTYVS